MMKQVAQRDASAVWRGATGQAPAQAPTRGSTPGGPMRLLIVTPRYPPFIGGVENHVQQVARRLAAAGVDVTVLTTDPTGRLAPEEVSESLRVIHVRAHPARRDYYFAPDIYRVIRGGTWDLVHVQSYHTFVAPLSMIASLRARIPYVVTFHGGGHSSRLRHALRGVHHWALRPLLGRAERLIALAPFEIDMYASRLHIPRERFVLIPSGFDVPPDRPARKETRGAIIASIGRLERYKGHQRVISAMPFVLAERPEARLWIMGSGPYEPQLRRQAQKLGVEDRVEIHSFPADGREQMAEQLSQADLAVSLSEYETYPSAVFEALTLGCPVAVADNSGLHELAKAGLAHAVASESTPEEVARTFLQELQQPLIPARIELPTWDACASELLALYSGIVRSPQCAS